MIHQFKDHVLSIYNHKNQHKCVEEEISLFMDANVVLQEMIVTHLQLDALLDALF
jgi:hypothetical protein